tara:strand:- start:4081 stop:4455 length:375 start_codon:yes stop_codon:yes gene_type:complete
MKQITVNDLQKSTYFKLDYRSPPCGIGYINFPNEDFILITHPEDEIKTLSEARDNLKPDSVPSDVIHISLNEDESWEKVQIKLNEILRKNNVSHVYDSELYYEFEWKSVGKHIFNLEDWIDIRS